MFSPVKKKVFVSYFLDLMDSLMSPVAKGTVREPAGSYLFIDKKNCQYPLLTIKSLAKSATFFAPVFVW
jgi:hypothetical protein